MLLWLLKPRVRCDTNRSQQLRRIPLSPERKRCRPSTAVSSSSLYLKTEKLLIALHSPQARLDISPPPPFALVNYLSTVLGLSIPFRSLWSRILSHIIPPSLTVDDFTEKKKEKSTPRIAVAPKAHRNEAR